jgi:hypothetical protein
MDLYSLLSPLKQKSERLLAPQEGENPSSEKLRATTDIEIFG